MFVYDVDGSLSGGLWYLYFRKVEKLSDEAARLRATRLGLKENADSQRKMWLAVQKVLAAGVVFELKIIAGIPDRMLCGRRSRTR